MQTKSLTLKFILHKILSWILVSGGSTQKMRVNLYGALLNFLNIVNLKVSPAEPEEEIMTATYVSRLDSSKGRQSKEESALKAMVIDVINGFGEKLCSIVCSDCIGAGHDVCRMVALSCLDTLIEINPGTDWMNTLTNQGYLRSLIDSLLQDDEGLLEALEPNPKSLRVVYVYESKLALLIKIAGTRLGAETLLAQGALARLAAMRALHCHPDLHAATAATPATERDTQFVPSVPNRFRQILVPALALCDALLTSLGTQNHSCVIHVTHFLISHVECVDMVLRAAHPTSPEGLLVELEALTSVIARASHREVLAQVLAEPTLQRCEAGLQRLRWLMLALLPRFQQPPPATHEATDARLYCKIVCNLLVYALNALESDGGSREAAGAASAARVLLQHLARRHRLLAKLLATVTHQLHSVPAMTLDDMKKLLGEETPASASPMEVRAGVVSLLRERVRARRRELHYCAGALAGALQLLWAHARTHLRGVSSTDTMSGGDELLELRKEFVALFNDRFVEELLETVKNEPPIQRGFVEILLKDIKTMIQFSPL